MLTENLDGYQSINIENFYDISWLLLTSSINHIDQMFCQVPRHYTSRRLSWPESLGEPWYNLLLLELYRKQVISCFPCAYAIYVVELPILCQKLDSSISPRNHLPPQDVRRLTHCCQQDEVLSLLFVAGFSGSDPVPRSVSDRVDRLRGPRRPLALRRSSLDDLDWHQHIPHHHGDYNFPRGGARPRP